MQGMVHDRDRIAQTSRFETQPSGHFAAYGVGVRLMDMRDPDEALGRVPAE